MSKKLGNMIREARTAKGITQSALAEQAGISSSEVGKIERGEKEPAQDVLKLMAKALGVTQKSLLEAASGTGSGRKTSSSGKTSSSRKTTSSGKTASASKTSTSVGTLTANEKKLVQLYRKADSTAKKAAMQILSGKGNMLEIIAPLVLGKKDMSSMASGLFDSFLSGKTGSQAGTTKEIIEEDS